jgi:hypothetical protein
MVEPRPGSHVFEQACFFLTSALDPSKGTTNPVPSSFKLTDLAPGRLADALGGGRNQLPWNVVMIPGLKEMPEGVGKSLLAFVQGGGGLVLFLDEGMSANRFNSELHALLPARLGNFDQINDITSPWRMALYDTNSPVFAAFRLPNSGDLRIPEFTKRFSMEVTADASRLAFFDDGQPLVIARALGRGRVLLVNTSSDTSWTDWPKHKTFVPFIHGLAKYAAQNTVQDRPEETSVEAGDDFELTTGLSGKAGQFTLRTPDAKELKITADAQGRLRDADLGRPGSYSLRDAAGREVRRLAVNLPAQESNLESLRHNDFLQQLTRVQEKPKETLAAGLFGLHNDEHEFWTVLLLTALVLVLVEPFIANRTSV